MAEAMVAGALLSGFINVVFDRLISLETVHMIQGKKLDKELLDRLKIALTGAEALLIDAEKKQFHDTSVKKWLHSLRDAVYDADDLLDFVLTKAATQKEEVSSSSNFLSRFLNFKDREIVTKMEEIVRRIEDIEKRRYILHLKEIPKENLSWRTPSTSLTKEGEIYGRDNDKDALIKLLKDENAEAKVSVIPVVGMGGVGKTTLALWLYNNEDLMKGFDFKAWVCVSEEFDIVKITQAIIKELTKGSCDEKDLNLLQLDLKEELQGRKFFIVLDDIWSDDYHNWTNLQKPFKYGAKGSKILATTRNVDVASVIQTCPPYFLHELSDEYCWSVFVENACFQESGRNSALEEIGRKIVKKCKGLPLAAETLGGLLRTKHDIKSWNAILKSDIWEFSVKDSKIVPALSISYYHLPPQLKRCFIYCSLYPKDYRFNKDELVLLWMAEDLIEQQKTEKTTEEVGHECFDDLASRLFFKRYNANNKLFVMHDLMHDLATFVAGKFYSQLGELGDANETSMMTRHLSYPISIYNIPKSLDSIGRLKSLRTLLPINDYSTNFFDFRNPTISMLFELKCLRVLSFNYFDRLDILPDSIGELTHLRYLDLSRTGIMTLPESLVHLYNLQTLKLFDCAKLTILPNGMQNLVNLRHLDIRGTCLEKMPPGMSKLKNLHCLSDFVVGLHEENGISELGELSNLHGSLLISKLENVADSNDALKARMMDKIHIDRLHLKWSQEDDMDTIMSSQIERDIFDKLQPHKGLRDLTIRSYRGTTFPVWLGHSSYNNMTRVSLMSCNNCCMLPSFGQLPSLKSLNIENFSGLVTIGKEFFMNDDDHSLAAPFSSLEDLSFCGMSCWEVWLLSDSNAFPNLKKLTIENCPKLTGNLPDHLPGLEKLTIRNCDKLVSTLPKSPVIRELIICGSDKVRLQEIPLLLLQDALIEGCEAVKSMFQAMTICHPTCLKGLSISSCSCVKSFPGDRIPVSLKSMEIYSCSKLEFPKQQRHDLLESLRIVNSCHSLSSFPLDNFPNLISLYIRNCENLESLFAFQPSHNDAANLDRVFISCMKYLGVVKCDKLKSLPCHMNTLLQKLEHLVIRDCKGIELFPEGGLPPSLKSLEISNCEKLLCHLSSIGVSECLTYLDIEGPCENVTSFPKDGCLLPQFSSLATLHLRKFSSLETLDCKMFHHLTSLETLKIHSCPKLENMTGGCLPASLRHLTISNCPLLEEQCKMKDPLIWPIISHIRHILLTSISIN